MKHTWLIGLIAVVCILSALHSTMATTQVLPSANASGNKLAVGECRRFQPDPEFTSAMLKRSDGTTERRVALVIGIDIYAEVTNVPNAVPDARAIRDLVSRIGFATYYVETPTLEELRNCVDRFATEFAESDLGLVFFTGHGIQVADDNYLLAHDASVSDGRVTGLMPLAEVSNAVSTGAKRIPAVILLDACRDLGLVNSSDSGDGRLQAGLAPVTVGSEALRNLLFAYATSPNRTAADGAGDHSPYATSLMAELATPGRRVEEALAAVANRVGDATQWTQTPWIRSSLTAPIYLNGELTEADAAILSRALAADSGRLLAKGDRSGALAKALLGLPERESDALTPPFADALAAVDEAYHSNSVALPLRENVAGAISVDGSRIATSTMVPSTETKEPLTLWETRTKQKVSTLLTEAETSSGGSTILGPRFSPDGTLIASDAIGGDILVWDAGTGRPLHRFAFAPANPGHGLPPYIPEIVYSDDGRLLAAIGQDGAQLDLTAIVVWDLESGKEIARDAVEHFSMHESASFMPIDLQFGAGGTSLYVLAIASHFEQSDVPGQRMLLLEYDLPRRQFIQEQFVGEAIVERSFDEKLVVSRDDAALLIQQGDRIDFYSRRDAVFVEAGSLTLPGGYPQVTLTRDGRHAFLIDDLGSASANAFDFTGQRLPLTHLGPQPVISVIYSLEGVDIAWIPPDRRGDLWTRSVKGESLIQNAEASLDGEAQLWLQQNRVRYFPVGK
mgnify:CR=1 FL=1